MSDILKISLIFVLIVLLLRKKWNIGYVMLTASGVLALSYLMPPESMLRTVKDAIKDPVTIKLAVALTSIRVFELILREKNILTDMMDLSKALLKNKRAVIVSMPLLIGLLPSVGGAYFSAPMVAESTKGMKMSKEEKGFLNYWFRHPWEYILPLYPGIVLATAISGIEMRHLILANLSYAVMIGITGFLFSMKKAKGRYIEPQPVSKNKALSFMPIAVVLLMVVLLHIELHSALLIAIAGLLVLYRYNLKGILRALRYGASVDVIVLIIGVMLFKETMEASGSVKNISVFFTQKGIPLMPMLFFLPFLTGILTGLTVGFVGSTFPLLLSLMIEPSLAAVSFAFASGFIGVLLSPVHVCLVLTREYFKADLWGMYKKMLPASLIILTVAIIQYLVIKTY